MIQAGLEYGCVFTGVAIIFVRVPEDDCTTVEYALAVPHGDVGLETGWTADLQQGNRLHLTAVGQLLAFSLNATRSSLRSEQWRQSAENRLKRWEVVVEAVEDSILESEVPSSDYQPPASEWDSVLIHSPICRRLRPRRRRSTPEHEERACPTRRGDDDDDEEGDDQSPSGGRADADNTASQSVVLGVSRTSKGSRRDEKHQSGSHRASQRRTSFMRERPSGLGPYCTASCLQGLIGALPLDTTCANFHLHPRTSAHPTHHAMNAADFRRQMQRVLRERCHVEELFFHGYKGFLYRIRLPDSGYTVVAKGTRPRICHRPSARGQDLRTTQDYSRHSYPSLPRVVQGLQTVPLSWLGPDRPHAGAQLWRQFVEFVHTLAATLVGSAKRWLDWRRFTPRVSCTATSQRATSCGMRGRGKCCGMILIELSSCSDRHSPNDVRMWLMANVEGIRSGNAVVTRALPASFIARGPRHEVCSSTSWRSRPDALTYSMEELLPVHEQVR